MSTLEIIQQRLSVNAFDPEKKLSEEEIRELVRYAAEAPSSFNIQHWRFIAVTDSEARERLKSVAFGQQKVVDAAVTFIILGDLEGHSKLGDILGRAQKAGIINDGIVQSFLSFAGQIYENPAMRRDEAIRSASFAAMTLMLAAQAKGLVSAPMIGFDAEGVKREFGISDRYVPVLLLAVGYAAPGNWPRKPRLGVDEILAWNKSRDF
jgi:nitroreductase